MPCFHTGIGMQGPGHKGCILEKDLFGSTTHKYLLKIWLWWALKGGELFSGCCRKHLLAPFLFCSARGTSEEEQTQGCSSCSSALRPHLETPGEKTKMLKHHMDSTSPKPSAAGEQMFYYFKEIHVHIPASPYLSPNYLAGVEALPTGKRCFWTLLNTGENIAGQQINPWDSGISILPEQGSRCSLQGGKQNDGSTILQFPCSSAGTPLTEFCTSSGAARCSAIVWPDLWNSTLSLPPEVALQNIANLIQIRETLQLHKFSSIFLI